MYCAELMLPGMAVVGLFGAAVAVLLLFFGGAVAGFVLRGFLNG